MRTLASTFESRDDAEAASQGLEEIGVPRDSIVMKYVAPGGGESGFYISAKVAPEQVDAATEILKRRTPAPEPARERVPEPRAEEPPPPPQPAFRPVSEPELPPRPTIARAAEPGSAAAAGVVTDPTTMRNAAREREKKIRLAIYYALALVGAFMIGAWLRMLA
jgi:hypothetical protein